MSRCIIIFYCLLVSSAVHAQNQHHDNISIVFQATPVAKALLAIFELKQYNLVIHNDVKQVISLKVNNLPWDKAFELVLNAANLSYYKLENTLFVGSAIAVEDYKKSHLQLIASSEEPIIIRNIKLIHTQANTVAKMLFNSIDSNNDDTNNTIRAQDHVATHTNADLHSVIVDNRTNSLIVQATRAQIDKILTLIKHIDVPLPQVMIRSDIVVTKDSIVNELGVVWNKNTDGLSFKLGKINNSTQATMTHSSLLINYDKFNAGSNNILSTTLSALEAEGRLKVIAQPKITASNGQTSNISSGTQIPYIVTTVDSINTQFKEAALSLTVTPNITSSDNVMLDLAITQDAVGTIYSNIPSIDTNSIETYVAAKHGETTVLGGLFTANTATTVSKVPVLGDIPWLGLLFQNKATQIEKVELLVFITPYILSN